MQNSTMTRPAATVTAPCPAWCAQPHGSAAPVHAVTAHESDSTIVTLIQPTMPDGTLGEALVWIYKPGDSVWALRASVTRPAGEIFANHPHPSVSEHGRALLAAADLYDSQI